MRTIKDPQLIHITANVVVARPHVSKRATSLQNHLVKSEFICRVRQCPFQDEKAFMFCFPENEHLRVEWARVCDLSRSNTSDNTDRNCWVPRVCSYHFDKTDWTLTPTGFRDLKSDARPRLHLPDREPAIHPSSVGRCDPCPEIYFETKQLCSTFFLQLQQVLLVTKNILVYQK